VNVPAEHEGVCGDCGGRIRVGQLIVFEPLDAWWAHAECPRDVERPVCPSCFTIRSVSGSCLCGVV
jgi:hypothetical protein